MSRAQLNMQICDWVVSNDEAERSEQAYARTSASRDFHNTQTPLWRESANTGAGDPENTAFEKTRLELCYRDIVIVSPVCQGRGTHTQ